MTRDGYVSLRVRIAFPEDAGHYTCCATNIMVTSIEYHTSKLPNTLSIHIVARLAVAM